MISKAKVKIEWEKNDKAICYIVEKYEQDQYIELVRIYNVNLTSVLKI